MDENVVIPAEPAISETRAFKKDVSSSPVLVVFLVVGVLLLLYGVLSTFGVMSGADLGAAGYLCNFVVIVLGFSLLMAYLAVSSAAKQAKNVVLTIDAVGLGESGYSKAQLDWKCAWSEITMAKKVIFGKSRTLQLFTGQDEKKPKRILEGYPLEELVEAVNKGLASHGKTVM